MQWNKVKKMITVVTAAAIITGLVGCGSKTDGEGSVADDAATSSDAESITGNILDIDTDDDLANKTVVGTVGSVNDNKITINVMGTFDSDEIENFMNQSGEGFDFTNPGGGDGSFTPDADGGFEGGNDEGGLTLDDGSTEASDGSFTPDADGGFGAGDGVTPEKPDGDNSDGTAPEKPGGDSSDGTAPEKPDGDSSDGIMPEMSGDNGGFTPNANGDAGGFDNGAGDDGGLTLDDGNGDGTMPEMPDGDGTMPDGDAMQGMFGGETTEATLTIADEEVLTWYEGDESAGLSDITEGMMIAISFDENGIISDIRIADMADMQGMTGGGQMNDRNEIGAEVSKEVFLFSLV